MINPQPPNEPKYTLNSLLKITLVLLAIMAILLYNAYTTNG